MRYKLPGHERKTVKTCALETQVLLGNVKPKKPRKERAKETKPRDRAEDKLRTEIVKALRKNSCFVFRLEPATRGVWGVSDLLVFTPKNKMIFMEVKTDKGRLSEDQLGFSELCILSDQKYVVVKTIQGAIDVVKDIPCHKE